MDTDQLPDSRSHHAVIAAIGAPPAAPNDVGALDSGLTPERLRREREHDCAHALHLLAPLAYFVLGFDSAILRVNLAGAELLGIARADCGRHRFRSFISPPFLSDFNRFLRHVLNSGAPQRLPLHLAGGGSASGFPVTLQASADGSGQALRLEVEPAEGRQGVLERSEQHLRRMVHHGGEGVWEIDAAARTRFVNPSMAQMLGYAIEDMLGRPLLAFVDDEGRAIVERNMMCAQQGAPERHDFKFIRRDGSALWSTLSIHSMVDGGGVFEGALALVTDVTEYRAASARIWHHANFDQLTALPNRHMLVDRLGGELKKAAREQRGMALLFIDLDHFKQVNDLLGHEQGDALLAEAARRLAGCVRGSDTVARLGGDEFAAILSGIEHGASVERVARDMVACLAQPFTLGQGSALVSASIGVALYPVDAVDGEQLLRRAEQAMYAAKQAGGKRCAYVTPELQAQAQLRMRTAAALREALAASQFDLYYQPIVNLRTGAVQRAEALLRWHHPQRGLLEPAQFMPCAESSGLIVEIGDWVFRQVVCQAKCWQSELDPAFQVSINQSPLQLRSDAAFYQGWTDCLTQQQLAPASVVIDLREAILLDGARHVGERLRQFRTMGLQLALDNFGTGHASLSHLKRCDVDFLKLDTSFVHGLETDAGERALCGGLIAMAHKLGLEVVAEGVETAAQRALLIDAGCDYAQGYLFAHPLPAAQFAALARDGARPH